MKTDIIIPTNRYIDELTDIIKDIKANTDMSKYNLIVTCLQVSAATNRNYGLIQANSEKVIMLDDDISGFYPGWADDMLKPLKDNVMMVSARLMNIPDEVGVMMDIKPDLTKPLQVVNTFYDIKDSETDKTVPVKAVPSACIAFYNDREVYFDEGYIGAGFEDTDICFQMCCKYPEKQIVINNECKLIHKNEMKNQLQGQLQKNQLYFQHKWGLQ